MKYVEGKVREILSVLGVEPTPTRLKWVGDIVRKVLMDAAEDVESGACRQPHAMVSNCEHPPCLQRRAGGRRVLALADRPVPSPPPKEPTR